MIARQVVAWALWVALAGCGGTEPGDGTGEPASGDGKADAVGGADGELARRIVEVANGASSAELRALGLDSRQAGALVAGRPFTGLRAVGDAPYIGDAALRRLLAGVAPEAVEAGAGFWHEVLLDAEQAGAVLDMANSAALLSLGCDLGFTSSMAGRILAGRPYRNLDALAGTNQVGRSQLERLKGRASWWLNVEDVPASRHDCVAFTAEEEAAAVQVANDAGYSQLGGPIHGLLAPRRPFTDAAGIAAVRGIGPRRMSMVRWAAQSLLAGHLSPQADSVRGLLAGRTGSPLAPGALRVLGPRPSGVKRTFSYSDGRVMDVPCFDVADVDDSTGEATVPFCHEAMTSQWTVDFHEITIESVNAWERELEAAAAAGRPHPVGVLHWESRADKGPFLFRKL